MPNVAQTSYRIHHTTCVGGSERSPRSVAALRLKEMARAAAASRPPVSIRRLFRVDRFRVLPCLNAVSRVSR